MNREIRSVVRWRVYGGSLLVVAGVLLSGCCAPARGTAMATVTAPATAGMMHGSAAQANAGAASGAVIEVRFISLAPSPYTNRHDALRAGMGIFLSLQKLIETHGLPLQLSFYDGAEFYDDRERIARVLDGPEVLVIGGSTWMQGPAYYVRRFFELAGGAYLGGVTATAWATAGGAHTGGEEVVSSILRSMMGMGAETFILGQKYMVFTTDERPVPPQAGEFTLTDVWYMDLFARYIAVVALSRGDRQKSAALSKQLAVSPYYYMNDYPHDASALEPLRPLMERLNAAQDPASQAYRDLRALIASAP